MEQRPESLNKESSELASKLYRELFELGLSPFAPGLEFTTSLRETNQLRTGGTALAIHTSLLNEEQAVAVTHIVESNLSELFEVSVVNSSDNIPVLLINRHLN